MDISKITKYSFCVIGKEELNTNASNLSQKTWQDVNNHFNEIRRLIKWDDLGKIDGMWGIMTNYNHQFEIDKNDKKNYYLAGFECDENIKVPNGWKIIKVPSYQYIKVQLENAYTFNETVKYMISTHLDLVGMIQQYINPENGAIYLLFPYKKINQ